jgi:hypothetical protein
MSSEVDNKAGNFELVLLHMSLAPSSVLTGRQKGLWASVSMMSEKIVHLRGAGAKTGVELEVGGQPVGRRQRDGAGQRERQRRRGGLALRMRHWARAAHDADVAAQRLQVLVHLSSQSAKTGVAWRVPAAS